MKKPNPYDVYIDTELTDVKSQHGIVMQAAALRVHKVTKEDLDSLRKTFRFSADELSESHQISIPGRKHFNHVCLKCASAIGDNAFNAREFLSFVRGPDEFDYPRLVGYNIKAVDLPSIINQFGWDKEWIAQCEVHDVIHLVRNTWPKDRDRTLENVARVLGIPVDESRLHDPLYDCELTFRVDVDLNDRIRNGNVPDFIIDAISTNKEPTTGAEAVAEFVSKSLKSENFPLATIKPQNDVPELPPSPITDLEGIPAWDSPEGFAWAEARSKDPKWKRVKCPYCKKAGREGIMEVRMNGEANVRKSMDEFYYSCTNPNCKKRNSEYNNTMNMDGTVPRRSHRLVRSMDELLLS